MTVPAAVATILAAGSARASTDGGGQGSASAAEARRVERLELGSTSSVHHMLRNGATERQLAAAGGEDRPGSLAFPIPGARIGRGHGSGTDGYHKALDIVAGEGTAILAAERGIVVYTGDGLRGYGNTVVILHPGGWITYYAHCSGFVARAGQRVSRGQRIALVGSTGISRGPHLHLVLWVDGDQVDPYPFFRPSPGTPRSGPLPFTGHRVRRGETLAELAARYGVTESELREANHLGDGDGVVSGWQILIPVRMTERRESGPDGAAPPNDGTYAVVDGDTLSEIASRFSIPTDDLARWNDLADPSRIRTGMVLVLIGEEGEGGEAGTPPAVPTEPLPEGTPPATPPDAAPGATVAATREPPAEPADPPVDERPQVHVVRTGETLNGIARTLGIPVRDVLAANDLDDPGRILAGQRLVIPDVGGGPSGERVSEDGSVPAADLSATYRVRDGDSLWSIAREFRTSVRRILDLNPGIAPDGTIRAGQMLRVPWDR